MMDSDVRCADNLVEDGGSRQLRDAHDFSYAYGGTVHVSTVVSSAEQGRTEQNRAGQGVMHSTRRVSGVHW